MSFYRDEQFDKLSERWANVIIARERGAAKSKDVSAAFNAMTDYLDARFQAATEAAKATGTAGELFGYGSSEKKNCLLSKAQYDSCAPKNRTAYDIPLYAHSLPKCEGCKGYGVITHVSGQTPDNYQECNEECPECQGTGEAARQTAPSLEAVQAFGAAAQPVGQITGISEHNGEATIGLYDFVVSVGDLVYVTPCVALAATAAPVLSDEQIDHIARSYFADEHGQTKAKGVIHDALRQVGVADAGTLKEAERYRYLRSVVYPEKFYASGHPSWVIRYHLRGETFDSAIDHAVLAATRSQP